MAFVTMVSSKNALDGSIKKRAYDFLQKLQKNHTAPGLHIEPIVGARDPRVRTGRVNQQWRAVLYQLNAKDGAHFIYYGTWNHDEAIDIARRTVLNFNLALGTPEFTDAGPVEVPETPAPTTPPQPVSGTAPHGEQVAASEAAPSESEEAAATAIEVAWDNLLAKNWDVASLQEAGIAEQWATAALAATTKTEFTTVAEKAPEAQGLVLLGLVAGDDLATVREDLGLPAKAATDSSDEAIVDALKQSSVGFKYVGENPDELKEAIESADIDRWRVFLHPEQRKYATGSWNGAYRLSGGAGTGKTVVLLHRARHLHREEPQKRILLTTFTRSLASSLEENFARLAPNIKVVGVGEPGVAIEGIDRIASQVLLKTPSDLAQQAAEKVLGAGASIGSRRITNTYDAWMFAVESAGFDTTDPLYHPAFLEQEYVTVVLGNQLVNERDYLRVSRAGRGTALNRAKRRQLWQIFARYRNLNQLDNQLSFPEVCAIAAQVLELRAAKSAEETGEAQAEDFVADYVLADEAQDFNAPHMRLLRALAKEGPNDLFIAEDSHQRIYGQKITLSHFGVNIRGRSRRLRLNYRTTAENLAYAISLLQGNPITDLEGENERIDDYRSVRTGPLPVIITVQNRTKEIEAAGDRVEMWLENGVRPEAIGILASRHNRIQ
ncbi:MAG: UvrD-helicase domain-containing protein, partial [Bowdeniella nasicola]|nr:UvrD-helicase domain-containing protein [Bowdeniella nasicola]